MRTEPRHAQRLSAEKEEDRRGGEEEVSSADPDGQPSPPLMGFPYSGIQFSQCD